jgi:formylglycine-generating enzyme required for sulfatase activity
MLTLLLSRGVVFAAEPVSKVKVPVIDLVLVKGGCFQMGDLFGDGGNSDLKIKDETPAHQVCVNDFYLGKYEVTQDQWQMIMDDNSSKYKACGGNCPVDSVSWDMAQEFVKKLNAISKKKYRLPTEAEWEYAARSGGKKEAWSGVLSEADPKEYAWFDENSEDSTQPVGQKKPNGLGLYDMSGNVREWCQDWYHENFYGKSPKDNPVATAATARRVQRGGGFEDSRHVIRASARKSNSQDYDHYSAGLRLVLPAK